VGSHHGPEALRRHPHQSGRLYVRVKGEKVKGSLKHTSL
jgi:hypothetical protein